MPSDPAELLYSRGVRAESCTVVLAGRIAVAAGADKFRSDVANWGVLASRIFTDPDYVPDFSAWVVSGPGGGECRCVRLGCRPRRPQPPTAARSVEPVRAQ